MNRSLSFAFRITSAIAALCHAFLYGFLCVRTVMFFFYDAEALIDGGYRLVPKENVHIRTLIPKILPYSAAVLLIAVLAVFAVITLVRPRKNPLAVTMLLLVLLSAAVMIFLDTDFAEYLAIRYSCPPLFYLLNGAHSGAFLAVKFYPALMSSVFCGLSFAGRRD